jgi:hypothetical protein
VVVSCKAAAGKNRSSDCVALRPLSTYAMTVSMYQRSIHLPYIRKAICVNSLRHGCKVTCSSYDIRSCDLTLPGGCRVDASNAGPIGNLFL